MTLHFSLIKPGFMCVAIYYLPYEHRHGVQLHCTVVGI
jgi:hypothetical protein